MRPAALARAVLSALVAGLPGCASAGFAPLSRDAAPVPFVSCPVEKVRPSDAPGLSDRATLRAAGGERETALFGVYAPSGAGLRSVTIRREGGDGTALSRVRLSLVEDYEVSTPSKLVELPGVRGKWPDPVIPLAEGREGAEYRFEGGLAIPAGGMARFLAEFELARGFRDESRWVATASFEDGSTLLWRFVVAPYAFDLPVRRALATSCNLDANGVAKAHGFPAGSPEARELFLEYRRDMLARGLSPYYAGPRYARPGADERGVKLYDLGPWEREALPYLAGDTHPDAPPPTSFMIPAPADRDWEAFLPGLRSLLVARGVADRAFLLLSDEPLVTEYAAIDAFGSRVRALAPEIATMLTEPWSPRLEDAVTIFCPDIPALGDTSPILPLFFKRDKPVAEWQVNHPPAVYLRRSREGARDWLYSCNSAMLIDTPNLFVDSPAAWVRAHAWLAFRYGFRGLLYWHANAASARGLDPWTDQRFGGCHGDGNLYFPGTPDTRWLGRHAPVPSLRMILLGEALEDYEYLALAESLGRGEEARAIAAKVAPSSLGFARASAAYAAARDRVAALVEEALGAAGGSR